MKIIVATTALVFACYASFAGTYGGWTYSVSNNQATITAYTGAGGAVAIPSTVNGIPVVKIGLEWPSVFQSPQNTSVTAIIIPNSVISIGDYAFYGCTSLTSVTIPNSVTSIGNGSFQYCAGLTSVTIPNSVRSFRDATFNGCTGLTRVTIPDGLCLRSHKALNHLGAMQGTHFWVPMRVNVEVDLVDVGDQRFELLLRALGRKVSDLRFEGADEVGGRVDDRSTEF